MSILSSSSVFGKQEFKNKALLIDNSLEALILRAQMIESASEEILIMYYQFHGDPGGMVLLGLLKQAAYRGVSIRIILDSYENTLRKADLEDLISSGDVGILEFNPFSLSTIFNPWSFSYRMHDKMLLVDRELFLTGGRNVTSHYYGFTDQAEFDESVKKRDFDYDEDTHIFREALESYIDRDILLSGDVVKIARDYFIHRWREKITVPVRLGYFGRLAAEFEKLKAESYLELCDSSGCDPKFYSVYSRLIEKNCLKAKRATVRQCKTHSRRMKRRLTKAAKNRLSMDSILNSFKVEVPLKLASSGLVTKFKGFEVLDLWVNSMKEVQSVSFLSKLSEDLDKNYNGVNSLDIASTILNRVARTRNNLLIQTPYFIPTSELYRAMEKARESNPDLNISINTNSLESTNSVLAYAGYEKHRKKLLDFNVNLFELNGKNLLHAKSIVFDDQYSFIGTYNMDPRSQNINSEIGVLIEDVEFNRTLSRSISSGLESASRKIDYDFLESSLKTKYPSVDWKKVEAYYRKKSILAIFPFIEKQL
ncbi:MAG: phosphatidylserine/phosphatidylglycerophosphate/cardiolipin synthase family protein [Bdellovibrionales bacterium]